MKRYGRMRSRAAFLPRRMDRAGFHDVNFLFCNPRGNRATGVAPAAHLPAVAASETVLKWTADGIFRDAAF